MADTASTLPALRSELVIKPLGDQGQYVVKDPRTGAYFTVGEREHFLFARLDGRQSGPAICAAYRDEFGDPLSEEELHGFVQAAREQGLLQEARGSLTPDSRAPTPEKAAPAKPRQSLLHWRISLWDPDRFFSWLEPRIRFFWTRGFLLFSAGAIVAAAVLCWTKRAEVAASLGHVLRWETLAVVWFVLSAVTLLHECAHGLTCKHYGGEVHEIGFLLLYLLPGFYCNVSDAWLFPDKSKRLWVTFAGGYFELFLWSLAVFVWYVTLPYTWVYYLAFVVVLLCGVQTLFNFNPLLKLDGYYLLSDSLGIPNLQQRALDSFKSRVRWLLWGAPRPQTEVRSKLLCRFGLLTWLYSLAFLALTLHGLEVLLRPSWGALGVGAIAVLGLFIMRALFQGCAAGEVRNMITTRYKRTLIWLLVLGGLAAVLCLVEIPDRPGGAFLVRPSIRAELRAPVAGFLKEVYFEEGEQVYPGAVVARLELPDLPSRMAQKQAEIGEVQAKLRLLEIGPRPEEVVAQRQRVGRADAWCTRAQNDLERCRQTLAAELTRLDKEIAARRAECDLAHDGQQIARALAAQKAIAVAELQEALGKHRVAQARLAEAEAAKRVRQTQGTLEVETELARREKDLADARALLKLLEAGSRPEEIQAARAGLARLREEAKHLEEQQQRQAVVTAVPGLVATPRLREKIGQYFREGELICVVEELAGLDVEILIAEQDIARLERGQLVLLRARSLPLETITAKLERIAPVAGPGEVYTNLTVYCRLNEAPAVLRPGMTGYARIDTGRRSLGGFIVDRLRRFVRTEFWLW